MSSNTLEIIQGLAQAAANAYDGNHDERYAYDGKARKIGLRREEGDPILDSRVMDGFKVKFSGDSICIIYQSEWKKVGKIVSYNISGNRFLHHMVRYLVGSMVAISKGKYSIKQLKNELDNPKLDSKQFKAPSCGLVLNHIFYE